MSNDKKHYFRIRRKKDEGVLRLEVTKSGTIKCHTGDNCDPFMCEHIKEAVTQKQILKMFEKSGFPIPKDMLEVYVKRSKFRSNYGP